MKLNETLSALLLAVLTVLPAGVSAQQLYGTVVYSDASLQPGVYTFAAEAGTTLSPVSTGSAFNINGAAVRWNGSYYLFSGQGQDDGIETVSVSVLDGQWQPSGLLTLPPDWFASDLCVDPTTNTIYGVFASYSGTPELATVDPSAQQRTVIGTLAQSLVALAADATGLIYGIGSDGVLYRVSKSDARLTRIGSTGVSPQYMQSATFDLATNRLFWATTTPQDEGGLYEVDVSTGRAMLVAPFPGNEELVGLYSLSEGQPWQGGPDTPTAPTAVTLTYADGTATLSWQAPEKGIHDLPLDAAALTYSVTRQPGNVVVGEGLTATTFTETYAPEELTAFYYIVVAHHGGLAGDAAQSNIAVAGTAVTPPYVQTFDDEVANSLLTTIDGDGDGDTWLFQHDAAFLWGAPFEMTNDYLVTPLLRLDSRYAYRLRLQTWCDLAANYPYTLTAYAGKEATTEGLNRQLLRREHIGESGRQHFDELFMVPTSGTYHVGIAASGYDLSAIYLDNLSVEQGPRITAPRAATDLTATADAHGGAEVVLTFTAPVQTLQGFPIGTTMRATICRDGEQIGQLMPVTAGQQLSYTDSEAKSGQTNTYVVTMENASGEGQQAEVSLWVGYDAPTQPLAVSLRESGGTAVLTWQAPVAGQHGGVVDAGSLRYGVVRNDGQLVATALEDTHFEEPVDHSGDQHWLVYGVQVANELGYSEVATSNGIIAGKPYALPFYEGFASGQRTNFWGTDNYNEQGWGSTWGGYADSDADDNGGFMAFGFSGGYEKSGSRLFTGRISMDGAREPFLAFSHCHRSETSDGTLGSPLRVSIVSNGTDTVLVRSIDPIFFWQADLDRMFVRDTVSLADFADAGFIQVLFDVVNAGTTYTYIDAVEVASAAARPDAIAPTAADGDTPASCYGPDGRRREGLRRGLNIVRRGDGSTSKVIVR